MQVSMGVIIDDRLLWISDPNPKNAALHLGKAIATTKEFDEAFDFVENLQKSCMFVIATCQDQCAFKNGLSQHLGEFTSSFKHLGMNLNLGSGVFSTIRHANERAALQQLKRIPVAIGGSQVHRRRKMVAQLIIPKLTWGGQWFQPEQKTISKWRVAIEKAVWPGGSLSWKGLSGTFPCRSLAAMWLVAMGSALDPQFRIDMTAVSYATEGWRRTTVNAQRQMRSSSTRLQLRRATTRLEAVAHKWSWVHEGGSIWRTRLGKLDLARDSRKVVRALADLEWQRTLLKNEPRASDEASQSAISLGEPCWKAHHQAFQDGRLLMSIDRRKGREFMRAALLASEDYRRWHTLNQQRLKRGQCSIDTACMCGEAEPTRRHWVWNCNVAMVPPLTRACRCPMEEGLLVAIAPTRPVATDRDSRPHAGMRKMFLSLADTAPGERVRCAFDGGSRYVDANNHQLGLQVATWGVAIQGADGLISVFGGRVAGVDQTSYAAETAACLQLLRAAAGCSMPLMCLGDNQAVLACADACLKGSDPPRDGFGNFEDMVLAVGDMRRTFDWVPAHGKHLEWKVQRSEELGNEGLWRLLNDSADKAATAAANEAVGDVLLTLQAAWRTEEQWSAVAVAHLARAALQYRDLMESRCVAAGGLIPPNLADGYDVGPLPRA
jgi:hypothetical protein